MMEGVYSWHRGLADPVRTTSAHSSNRSSPRFSTQSGRLLRDDEYEDPQGWLRQDNRANLSRFPNQAHHYPGPSPCAKGYPQPFTQTWNSRPAHEDQEDFGPHNFQPHRNGQTTCTNCGNPGPMDSVCLANKRPRIPQTRGIWPQ